MSLFLKGRSEPSLASYQPHIISQSSCYYWSKKLQQHFSHGPSSLLCSQDLSSFLMSLLHALKCIHTQWSHKILLFSHLHIPCTAKFANNVYYTSTCKCTIIPCGKYSKSSKKQIFFPLLKFVLISSSQCPRRYCIVLYNQWTTNILNIFWQNVL